MPNVKSGSWSETNCCRSAPDDVWWDVGKTWDHERERKGGREQVPPHFLARLLAPLTPLFVLMGGLRPTGVKVTHTLAHSPREAVPFCLFRLISGTDWASRRRLTFDVRFEKITPPRATDQTRWQCNFDLCVCVCLSQPLLSSSPPAPSYTPLTPPSWSTYVRKRAEIGRGLRTPCENEDDVVVYFTQTL